MITNDNRQLGALPLNPTSGHPEAEGAETAFPVLWGVAPNPSSFGIAQRNRKASVFHSIRDYRETLK